MNEQDSHVHPIVTPAGGSVIFTSDGGGSCNVYEVALPPDMRPENAAAAP